MASIDSKRGASNLTIIVVILILGLGLFLVFRVGPIYYGRTALQKSLDHFLKAEAMRMSRGELIDEVVRYAEEADVPVTGENVTILYGDGNQITIKVNYTAQADLIVTRYEKPIEIVSVSPVWKIEERVSDEVTFPSTPGATESSPRPPPGGPYTGRARDVGKKIGR